MTQNDKFYLNIKFAACNFKNDDVKNKQTKHFFYCTFYFKVIGSVNHLPIVDFGGLPSPEVGTHFFSSNEEKSCKTTSAFLEKRAPIGMVTPSHSHPLQTVSLFV